MERRAFLASAITASAAFDGKATEEQKAELKSAEYVILELMGHKKLAGRISAGPVGLMRFDAAVEGGTVTQMINPQSIYRMTLVTEEAVREFAQRIDPLPLITIDAVPRQLAFDEYNEVDDDDDWHR